MQDPLFLGLDLSTQSLKAVLIQDDGSILAQASVNFDKDLPYYQTTNGAIRGPDVGEVTSPVAMWLEAIDLVISRLQSIDGVDLSRIRAISGDGQQHGSVYWSTQAETLLANLGGEKSLVEQLSPSAFTFQRAPIWQDSSTTRECRELEKFVGGSQALTDLTGSRAYERFTGNQIRRLRRLYPEAYAQTSRISLVSSFIPSLFLGSIAPIEASDASGTNLMDVLTLRWLPSLLDFCGGPELATKLGPEPATGGTVLGRVGSYWVSRYGFSEECLVAPFTGDNPATVVALSNPGDALLSLGTSTTLLLSIPPPPPDSYPRRTTTSHLLAHPTTQGAFIGMLCYKNGALAREDVKSSVGSDWQTFNNLVEAASPLGVAEGKGKVGLWFPEPEIIPPGVKGTFFFDLSLPSQETDTESEPEITPISQSDVPQSLHPRLILESQLLALRSHVQHILPSPPSHSHHHASLTDAGLTRLVLSGGASANPLLRQLAADVLGLPVYVPIGSEQGAAVGGAWLAKWVWWRSQADAEKMTFEEMKAMDAGMGDEEGEGLQLVAVPDEKREDVYAGVVGAYGRCEEWVVKACASA